MNRYRQIEQIKETYKDELPEPKEKWPRNVRIAFTFILEHLFDPRQTITWMKAQCGIHRRSFASRFYKHVKWYPKDYILHHRIEVAKQIMKQTDVPVTIAAVSVGFNSSSLFSNSFKVREDLTPSRWREQN